MNDRDQTSTLYGAERGHGVHSDFRGWIGEDPDASSLINIKQARKLATSVVHSPAMENIPGIDYVRSTYDPKDVSFHKRLVAKDPETGEVIGIRAGNVVSGYSGITPKIQLTDDGTGKVPAGLVTHELAHHLLSESQFAGHYYPDTHGWQFARAHVHIVRNTLGHEAADNLKSYYRAHGVNFGINKI